MSTKELCVEVARVGEVVSSPTLDGGGWTRAAGITIAADGTFYAAWERDARPKDVTTADGGTLSTVWDDAAGGWVYRAAEAATEPDRT